MSTYELAVETGPKRKKTYIHVLNLMGGNHQGPTTDEAIDTAPDAIREYLRFLHRHGESVDPDQEIELDVTDTIMDGSFLGSATLEADNEPLTAAEVDRYCNWLEWGLEELTEKVRQFDAAALTEPGPEHSKRPIRRILQHILGADAAYLALVIKGMKEVNAIAREADKDGGDPLDQLTRMRAISIPRLRAMSPEERAASRMAGQHRVTSRRMMRNMLEHQWEHLREIERRIR